jgi:carotenoid cleavage dioxygenase
LIGLANRHAEQRTDLLILDAERLGAGPIATVKLPIKLRNGVHGHYVPGHLLQDGIPALRPV